MLMLGSDPRNDPVSPLFSLLLKEKKPADVAQFTKINNANHPTDNQYPEVALLGARRTDTAISVVSRTKSIKFIVFCIYRSSII